MPYPLWLSLTHLETVAAEIEIQGLQPLLLPLSGWPWDKASGGRTQNVWKALWVGTLLKVLQSAGLSAHSTSTNYKIPLFYLS